MELIFDACPQGGLAKPVAASSQILAQPLEEGMTHLALG